MYLGLYLKCRIQDRSKEKYFAEEAVEGEQIPRCLLQACRESRFAEDDFIKTTLRSRDL